MTAKEYLAVRQQLYVAINAMEQAVEFARESVTVPPPDELRRATAADIVAGNVIYYWPGTERQYWRAVRTVQRADDAYKAYVAEDGSRDGLHEAWVEDVQL